MTEVEYLKSIERTIENINMIDFEKSWAYEKVVQYILSIEKLPIILFKYPENGLIFRSRIIINKEFFTNTGDISFPNEKYVPNFARCNRPQQSVFYGSENRPTSYMEFLEYLTINSMIGETFLFTIGGWRILKELILVLVYNPNDNNESNYNSYHREGFEDFIKQTPKEYRAGTLKFYEFIGKEFAKPVKENISSYLITTAYTNIVFSENRTNGILYPSVPSGGFGFNVALKKDWINEKNIRLENVGVDKFVLTKENDGTYNFINIDNKEAKEISNNKIIW